MSHAVIVPSLMMVTLIVSEESFARDIHTDRQTLRQTDRQTDRHTHTHTDTGSSVVTFPKSLRTLKTDPKKAC